LFSHRQQEGQRDGERAGSISTAGEAAHESRGLCSEARHQAGFALAVQAAGIRHRYIRPRRPRQNGKVERSHRIDQEEFWARHDFVTMDEAEGPLGAWEHADNHRRFSIALAGRTPFEKLQAKQATSADNVNGIQ
jgi:transposase InsO family protein